MDFIIPVVLGFVSGVGTLILVSFWQDILLLVNKMLWKFRLWRLMRR